MESTPKIRSGQQFSGASGDFSMFQEFRAQKTWKVDFSIFRPSISGPKRRPSLDFFSSVCSPWSTLPESALKSTIHWLYLEKINLENRDFWPHGLYHGNLADFSTIRKCHQTYPGGCSRPCWVDCAHFQIDPIATEPTIGHFQKILGNFCQFCIFRSPYGLKSVRNRLSMVDYLYTVSFPVIGAILENPILEWPLHWSSCTLNVLTMKHHVYQNRIYFPNRIHYPLKIRIPNTEYTFLIEPTPRGFEYTLSEYTFLILPKIIHTSIADEYRISNILS